mmetsp:Transcript_9944/g.34663  ORF Transcript_9944/g.34663 Transcript_9944/m.34663 type:complete len:301 (+) Transcript_9944:1401-2303(+)
MPHEWVTGCSLRPSLLTSSRASSQGNWPTASNAHLLWAVRALERAGVSPRKLVYRVLAQHEAARQDHWWVLRRALVPRHWAGENGLERKLVPELDLHWQLSHLLPLRLLSRHDGSQLQQRGQRHCASVHAHCQRAVRRLPKPRAEQRCETTCRCLPPRLIEQVGVRRCTEAAGIQEAAHKALDVRQVGGRKGREVRARVADGRGATLPFEYKHILQPMKLELQRQRRPCCALQLLPVRLHPSQRRTHVTPVSELAYNLMHGHECLSQRSRILSDALVRRGVRVAQLKAPRAKQVLRNRCV